MLEIYTVKAIYEKKKFFQDKVIIIKSAYLENEKEKIRHTIECYYEIYPSDPYRFDGVVPHNNWVRVGMKVELHKGFFDWITKYED